MTNSETNGRNLIRAGQDYCKYLLTFMGAFLSANVIYILNASINYLEVGRWMRAKGYVTRHSTQWGTNHKWPSKVSRLASIVAELPGSCRFRRMFR